MTRGQPQFYFVTLDWCFVGYFKTPIGILEKVSSFINLMSPI